MVISEDTQTYCWAFDSAAVTTCINELGLLRLGFEHPTFRLQDQRSDRLRHRRGQLLYCCIDKGKTNFSVADDCMDIFSGVDKTNFQKCLIHRKYIIMPFDWLYSTIFKMSTHAEFRVRANSLTWIILTTSDWVIPNFVMEISLITLKQPHAYIFCFIYIL